jgi:hypothetical protein
MLLLEVQEPTVEFSEPPGLVRKEICPLSGLIPTDLCPGRMEEVFISGSEPRQYCRFPHNGQTASARAEKDFGLPLARASSLKVVFPQDGDVFRLDPVLRPDYQSIRFRAAVPADAGITAVEWWVNGRRVGTSDFPYTYSWALKKGSWTIKAIVRIKDKRLESTAVKILVLS